MSDNLLLYKYFMVAADEKSITGAARRLYVSQPAVSSGIAKLEDSLGVSLFFRNNKGISLTAEGRLLYDYISRAFSFIEAGEDKLREISGLREGVLRIGASDMTLRFVLFDLIKDFKEKHSGIKLEISNNPTPKTLSQLRSGTIDLSAVSSPIPEGTDFEIIPVRKIRDIFVASSSYPASSVMTPAEIASSRIIMLDRETTSRRYIEDHFAKNSCALSPDIELATSDLLIDAAKRGLGIAAVVEDFAKEAIEKGELREIKCKEGIPEREMMIVYLRDIQLSAAAREFIRMAKEKLEHS